MRGPRTRPCREIQLEVSLFFALRFSGLLCGSVARIAGQRTTLTGMRGGRSSRSGARRRSELAATLAFCSYFTIATISAASAITTAAADKAKGPSRSPSAAPAATPGATSD